MKVQCPPHMRKQERDESWAPEIVYSNLINSFDRGVCEHLASVRRWRAVAVCASKRRPRKWVCVVECKLQSRAPHREKEMRMCEHKVGWVKEPTSLSDKLKAFSHAFKWIVCGMYKEKPKLVQSKDEMWVFSFLSGMDKLTWIQMKNHFAMEFLE